VCDRHFDTLTDRQTFTATVATVERQRRFLARDSIYAERAICYRKSVRPSICLSVCHTGGSVKNG